jgi:hypothetical protein
MCVLFSANLRPEKEAPKALVFSDFLTFYAYTTVPRSLIGHSTTNTSLSHPLLSPYRHVGMAFFPFCGHCCGFLLHPDLPDIPWLGALALCLMRIFLL